VLHKRARPSRLSSLQASWCSFLLPAAALVTLQAFMAHNLHMSMLRSRSYLDVSQPAQQLHSRLCQLPLCALLRLMRQQLAVLPSGLRIPPAAVVSVRQAQLILLV
jgi:hypothetical protein